MRTPYTQLYCHAVWATWDRERLITEEMEFRIAGAIRAKLDELECTCIAAGVMPDHVHVLFGFPPKVAISDVIGQIKGASSHLVNSALPAPAGFNGKGRTALSLCPEAESMQFATMC